MLPLPLYDAPKTWYGPATATFNVSFAGNPYDPAKNDVKVVLTGPKGKPIERLAYYDDQEHAWKCHVAVNEPGKYQAKLTRNGVPILEAPKEGLLDLTQPMKVGFIRRDPLNVQRFRRDGGAGYVPLGFNLGWQNGDLPPMVDQIARMGASGINWTRIWACHWDGKNPWWSAEEPKALNGELSTPALEKWSTLVKACEGSGVDFQMVLFHHGAFSSRVNPNWPEHPWNAKNGGFLANAADFFTDAEAKRRSKMWIRYAVSRWGHSPSVLAWELFNEVEWVDARYSDRWKDIETWHAEMADYIRSIDPYQHLITTSSAMDRPDLWKKMDYVQPHSYSPNAFSAILGSRRTDDLPFFFGEFGVDDMEKANIRLVARDGIYGGLLGNHAGPAQFWYWDYAHKRDIYSEYATAAEVIRLSDFYQHANARPVNLRVETAERTALNLVPGGGWEKATKTSFDLPSEATAVNLKGLSSYLQGQAGANKDLFPGGLTLRFRADRSGTVRVRLNQASKGGGAAILALDGKELARKNYPAGEGDRNLTDVLEAPFGPGEHTVSLTNPGQDWVRLARIEVGGISPQATVAALADTDWAMMRLTPLPDATSRTATLIGLPFSDGSHRFTAVDLATGKKSDGALEVKGSRATLPLAGDTILIVKAK